MKLTKSQIEAGLRKLEILPSDFRQVERAPNGPEALESLKTRARSNFRRLVVRERLHPDQGSDGETFIELRAVLDWLARLRIVPRQQPRPRVIVVRVSNTGSESAWTYGATANTSSTTTSGFGW